MHCVLTTRQRQIFDFISTEIRERHRAPTRAEIATQFGFRSANAAEDHVRALARRGVVATDRKVARGIRLTGLLPQLTKCNHCNAVGSLLLECRDSLHLLRPDLVDRINDELELWDPGAAPAHRCALGPTGDHGTNVAVRSVTGAAGSAVATVTTASLEGSDVNPSSVTVVTS